MKIKRFEELECWKEARELNRMIYSMVQRPKFSKDFRLAGQTTGASISVMNNICEGVRKIIDGLIRYLKKK